MKNSCFLIIAVLLAASCAKDNDKGAMDGKNSVKFTAEEVREAAWTPAQLTGRPQTKSQLLELEGVEAIGENVFLSVSCEPFDASPFAATKGIPVTSWTGSLGLYGYNYMGAWGGSSSKPNLAANLELTKNTNDDFYQSAIMWPDAGSTRFYAYAPYNVATATPANSTTAGVPELEYTVPDNIATQHDLLWASRGDVTKADCPDTVGFIFHHALTAIQFKISSNSTSGVIKKITLKNIIKKGTFNLDTKNWTPSAVAADKGDFVINLGTGVNAAANAVIADGANTLLMIPQSFTSTSNAVIEFSYYETNTPTVERKLTASLKNATWTKGSKMVYQLRIGSVIDEPVLEVTLDAASEAAKDSISWDGTGSLTFKVKSYRQMTGGGSATPYQAMPWSAEVKVGDTVVAATTIFNTALSGNGSATGSEETVTVTVKQVALMSANSKPASAWFGDHTIYSFFAAQPQLGTSTDYYNLSNQTNGGEAIENTANCYMIHAPGYYSFPLVYGNAIKNGSTNSAAYTSTASGSYILTTFLNHKGAGITTPYIKDSGDAPTSASIVWQDQPNLVTGVTLDMSANSGNGAIKFIVDRSTIKQGNAVIAVKNSSGVIMWSWHIWVTHYMLYLHAQTPDTSYGVTFVKNYSGVRYDMMRFNLGWCCDVSSSYTESKVDYSIDKTYHFLYREARNITVTFKQNTGRGSVASNVIITGIQQESPMIPTDTTVIVLTRGYKGIVGNSPYYQWGRKDPMLPSTGLGDADKPYYTTDTTAVTDVFVKTGGPTDIATTIREPAHMFANGNWKWCATRYDNLWSANNTAHTVNDNQVVKTIYDPSPVGYCVPPLGAYTGFTNNGQNQSVAANFNVSGSFDAGWNFYAEGWQTGSINIYFPAAGRRSDASGRVDYVVGDRMGNYWSAVPYDGVGGRSFLFSNSSVRPQNFNGRSAGFSIRPVREK